MLDPQVSARVLTNDLIQKIIYVQKCNSVNRLYAKAIEAAKSRAALLASTSCQINFNSN
jgi:hypothetical protein